jgi:hypothetical protein
MDLCKAKNSFCLILIVFIYVNLPNRPKTICSIFPSSLAAPLVLDFFGRANEGASVVELGADEGTEGGGKEEEEKEGKLEPVEGLEEKGKEDEEKEEKDEDEAGNTGNDKMGSDGDACGDG